MSNNFNGKKAWNTDDSYNASFSTYFSGDVDIYNQFSFDQSGNATSVGSGDLCIRNGNIYTSVSGYINLTPVSYLDYIQPLYNGMFLTISGVTSNILQTQINTISGSILTISDYVNKLNAGMFLTLSGITTNILQSQINSISGNILTISDYVNKLNIGMFLTLSGVTTNIIQSQINSISGKIYTINNGNFATVSQLDNYLLASTLIVDNENYNIGAGLNTLSNPSVSSSIAFGRDVFKDGAGYNNVGIGDRAFYNSTINMSEYSVGVGDNSQYQINTNGLLNFPMYNTSIGYNSGTSKTLASTCGAYNTFLGANTNIPANTYLINSTAIGYNATLSKSHQIQLGTISEYVNILNTTSRLFAIFDFKRRAGPQKVAAALWCVDFKEYLMYTSNPLA